MKEGGGDGEGEREDGWGYEEKERGVSNSRDRRGKVVQNELGQLSLSEPESLDNTSGRHRGSARARHTTVPGIH